MIKQKRILKKRYVFCISAIALLIISYFVFLCVYSRTYTLSLGLNGKADLSTVKVEYSSDNVVRVTDIRNGNINGIMNSLDIDLESVSHGKTDVTVYYEDVYDWEELDENDRPYMKHITEPKTIKESFHVSYIGNIWCSTDNNFKGIWTLRLLIDAIMIVLVITFSLTFREKQKNGDFTYSMVTLGGLIFFMSVTVVLSLREIFLSYGYRSLMDAKQILMSVTNVSYNFISITMMQHQRPPETAGWIWRMTAVTTKKVRSST